MTPGSMNSRVDNETLGIIALVCAVAGFFTLGILLGPIAMIGAWLAMERRWRGSAALPSLIALVLGAIDTLVSLIWLAGAMPHQGLL